MSIAERNSRARALAFAGGDPATIGRTLARRLEYLEDSLLPVIEEPTLALRIISVSANGERADTGIEFIVPAGPKPAKRRWR